MKDHPLTRELRRELREASLRQNDAKAFDVLEKILKIDPGDSDAVAQKKEVGKRLSAEHFEDLPELLEQGNIAAIRQMVENLRRWTDEQSLARFPGYKEAAAMVDAEINARNRSTLNKKLAEVAMTKDLRSKVDKAKEVEEFAAENRVILPDEQLKFLAKVHEEWTAHLEAEKRLEQVNTWAEEVEAIEAQAETMGGHMEALAIRDTMARLDQIQEGASAYQDVPENEELMRRTMALHDKLASELKQRARKRWMRKTIGSVLSLSFLGISGLVIYAYSTLDSAIEELIWVHDKKQIWKAQEVCVKKSFMGHLYSLISQEYVAVYNTCAKWYQNFVRDRSKFDKMKKEVVAMSKRDDVGRNPEFGNKLNSTIQHAAHIFTTYGFDPWPKRAVELAELKAPLREAIKSTVEEARNATGDNCFSTIFTLYKRCSDLSSVSKAFDDQELEATIQEAKQAMRRFFMDRCVALAATAPTRALACFDQYAEDMSLPPEGREGLSVKKYYQDTLTGLMNCTTLESYMTQLRKIEASQDSNTGNYPMKQMETIRENARGIAIHLALPQKNMKLQREYSVLPLLLDQNESIQRREKVPYEGKRIDAVKLIYEIGFNSAVRNQIQKLSTPLKKKGTVLRTLSRIYFGEVSTIGNSYFVKEYDKSGNVKEGQRLDFPKDTCKKQEKLKGEISIDKMGISTDSLDRGMVIPGDLLNCIAKYNNDAAPIKYKAYLFFHATRWLELLRGKELTGLEFSPSMRWDLEEFKKIAASMDLESDGCWYTSISIGEERRLVEFFRKAASHKYSEEILKNVKSLDSFSLTFVGYIDAEREAIFTKESTGTVYYFPRIGKDELEVATYTTGTANIAPYTPLFTLTH
ncbi:MAG: hypothetical protein MSQ05_06205 [Akkermansia sp.]|nr:hypothetical protein [Akkermansia sp.]